MQRGLFKNVLKIRHQGQIVVRAFLKGVEGDDLLEKSLQRIGGGIPHRPIEDDKKRRETVAVGREKIVPITRR